MEPLICYECGNTISDKWDAFCFMREICSSLEENRNIHVNKKAFDFNNNQDLEVVFKVLGIKKYCCRGHFTSIKDINDLSL